MDKYIRNRSCSEATVDSSGGWRRRRRSGGEGGGVREGDAPARSSTEGRLPHSYASGLLGSLFWAFGPDTATRAGIDWVGLSVGGGLNGNFGAGNGMEGD